MSEQFAEQLATRTLQQAADGASEAIALLGSTAASLTVRSALHAAGLGDRIVGVFDHRDPARPGSRPLADLAQIPHDLLVVGADAAKDELLEAYRAAVGDTSTPPRVVLAGIAHLDYADRDFAALNAPALVPSYATGSPYTREHLFQCLQASAANGLSGAIVEFGAFKGGTTAWLARVAEHGLSPPSLGPGPL